MPFMAAAAPYIALAATALGTGVSVLSAVGQGQAQKAAMKEQSRAAAYNRQVAEQNAQAVEAAGRLDIEQQRREHLQILGAQKARYGAAGVIMEGTPLEVMAQTASDMEQDILTTQYNYDVKAARWRSEAGFYDYEAMRNKNLAPYYSSQSTLKAGTALLTGASQVGSSLMMFKK